MWPAGDLRITILYIDKIDLGQLTYYNDLAWSGHLYTTATAKFVKFGYITLYFINITSYKIQGEHITVALPFLKEVS